MLWGNRNLKIDGKCLYSKFMIDVNLFCIQDVVLHNLQNKIHSLKTLQ